MATNNTKKIPPPPPERPLPTPPRIDSLWNYIVRRVRAAKTIFGDRVKLVLRQSEAEQWAKLDKPYLLVIPTQTRTPIDVEVDYPSFVNPRAVTLVGQFDGRGSEMEYMAANDIETAERQLIYVLANWIPPIGSTISSFKQTEYAGLRLLGTKEPDVKVYFQFNFFEQYALPDEAPTFEGEDQIEPLVLEKIKLHVIDPTCNACVSESLPLGPDICVESGGCPVKLPPDPCAPPDCPPILGDGEEN